MAIIKEFEVKANTQEAVDEVEKLREELDLTEKKVGELEDALDKANKTASKGSKEVAAEDRESKRAKEEVIRTIDRATGGYVEMGKKALKAYKVISAELVRGITLGKEWIASFSFTGLIAKVKGFGQALQASFKAGTLGAKSLRAALISSGIGALVVALGAIVAYWDDIKGAVNGVSTAQQKQLTLAEENVKAQIAASEALSLQENSLKLQGKSEKEIRDLKIQQTNETITALEAQLETQKQVKQSQVDAAKRNKDILQGIIRFLSLPLTALLATVDLVGKALGQDFGLEEKFSGGIAKLVFDPEEVAKEGDATIEETEKQLAKLKSQRDGYLLDEKKDRDAAAKQRLEDAKKLAEQLQKLEEETAAIRGDIFVNAAQDEAVKENRRYVNRIKQLGLQRKQELAAAEGNEELIKAIKEKYQAISEQEDIKHTDALAKIAEDRANKLRAIAEKVNDINTSLIEDAQTRELAQLELKYQREVEAAAGQYDLLEALKAQHEKQKADIEAKYDAEAVKKRKDFQNQIKDIVLDAASTTIKNLMDLNDIYDKNDEAAAKRAFERNKSLQIVQAIINTAGGIMGQLNVPQDQLTGANWIKAALIATTGATQIATISAQEFNGGKGGGAAPKAPSAPQVAPSFNIVGQSGTNQLLESIAGQFNQPLRAYVVGGDVTSAQEMERKRIRTATFG
jgi:hypothetical protein